MAEHRENVRTPDDATEVTPSEWWQRSGEVLIQSVKDLLKDDAPQWAAAIAYYSLLSTFPLILAIVSVAAFFVDPEWAINQTTQWLGEFLPQGQNQIEEVIQGTIEARGSVSILSILGLLWAASRVFGTLTKALNIAFDADEMYGFLKRTAIELIMVLTIGLLFIVAITSGPLLRFLGNTLQVLPVSSGLVFSLLTEAVPALLLLLSFFLIYLYVPRRSVEWQAALPGAVLATILFLVAQPLFTGYVRNFGNYNLIYGSLAVVVIMILWAWISALILLFGSEIASHIQSMLIEGQPAERVEQRHKERSPTHPKS